MVQFVLRGVSWPPKKSSFADYTYPLRRRFTVVLELVDERSLHTAATRAVRAGTMRSPLVGNQLSASIRFLCFPWRVHASSRCLVIHCAVLRGRSSTN